MLESYVSVVTLKYLEKSNLICHIRNVHNREQGIANHFECIESQTVGVYTARSDNESPSKTRKLCEDCDPDASR